MGLSKQSKQTRMFKAQTTFRGPYMKRKGPKSGETLSPFLIKHMGKITLVFVILIVGLCLI